MNYILKPSLKHMAILKVAAALWNQNDVKVLLAEFCIPQSYTELKPEWVKIEAVAEAKVANLPLPEQLKEEILCFIRPIGYQIAKWRQFHFKGCSLSVDLPSKFHWKPEGIIDKRKTAEMMIRDENIDIATRYKLSCIFCLEEDIPKLWEEMSESSKKLFYNEEDPAQVKEKELVILWTYLMKGEGDKMDSVIEKKMERKCSPYQYAFELAALDGNRVATEYFLHKLTPAEKEESLVRTAASVAKGRHWNTDDERTGFLQETYSHVFCFLLSHLNEEQQLEVFKLYPFAVLVCLLDWPWQPFFMQTANSMWDFHPKLMYQFIWIYFTGNVIDGCKDFDYLNLFREFWECSPPDYKEHFFRTTFRRIVSELFEIADKDTIEFVFQRIDPDQKRNIIYHYDAKDICKKLMKGNHMSLLRYFIKECLPSKNDVIEFKESFEGAWHVRDFFKSWHKKFLRVLNSIFREFKKRKSGEEECSKSKRV